MTLELGIRYDHISFPTFVNALIFLRPIEENRAYLERHYSRSVIAVHDLAIVFFLAFAAPVCNADMVKVIIETDMTLDVDDVGALAVIHALANRKEAELLGVSFNEVHPDGVRGIAAINAWYDRANTPIGRFEGTLIDPDESRYLNYLAKMIRETIDVKAHNALDFYERILKSQQDQSVTIVSLGFLNNLADLLRTHPDLVQRKVRRLVAMGGRQNDNFNFVRHGLVHESQFVIENWPTPLVITDFGGNLHTGASLSRQHRLTIQFERLTSDGLMVHSRVDQAGIRLLYW